MDRLLQNPSDASDGVCIKDNFSLDVCGLHEDIIFVILSFCDIPTLGKLSQTCSYLRKLIYSDSVWKCKVKNALLIGDSYQYGKVCKISSIPLRNRLELCMKWEEGTCFKKRVFKHKKQIPWMQLSSSFLWISNQNSISGYDLNHGTVLINDGYPRRNRKKVINETSDIARFICKEDMVLVGTVKGCIRLMDEKTCKPIWGASNNLDSGGELQTLDFHENRVVAGYRDATVRLFKIEEQSDCKVNNQHYVSYESNLPESTPMSVMRTCDRIWSIAFTPDGSGFITGTSGISSEVSPLCLWNPNRDGHLLEFGKEYRRGAGVLDVKFESQHVFYSAGYDTCVRKWDTRINPSKCVQYWEEPFDLTVFSISIDGDNTLITGTSHHGMTRLWDKRQKSPIQVYYAANNVRSPVYSLVFNPAHLYLALDTEVQIISFR